MRVSNNSYSEHLLLSGKGPLLIGRDWLREIRKHWENIFDVKKIASEENTNEVKMKKIFERHESVFQEGLGRLKDTMVHIDVCPDAKPRFCKATPVSYALQDRLDNELDRLVREGIDEPVNHSKWATPVVPVIKSDGSIHLCGGYKQTVNKAAICDYYPLPKVDDSFATLSGGEKFTKLDIAFEYQQLELHESSRELLTVNTHRGLFQPTSLQFGVHSAPGIF